MRALAKALLPMRASRRAMMAVSTLGVARSAWGRPAQRGYPHRPIRVVLPVAPGGSGDIVARILGQGVQDLPGHPMIIDPRPGAGGMIATHHVARSPAEGYTHLGGYLPAGHVPYRGAGPAIHDVMAGKAHRMAEGMPSLLPFIRAGRPRALAIAAPARHAGLPEVPATAEAGLPDFVISDRLALFVASVRTPSIRDRLTEAGLDVAGSSSTDADACLDRENARWVPVVEAAGLRG